MRVVFYWEAAGLSLDRANPYGGLLARALDGIGVEMVAGHGEELSTDWVRANRGLIDVLHLNWPHYLYEGPDLAGRLARAEALLSSLSLARQLGYKVVWTVHNLYPHESAHPELDRLVRLAITGLATAVIVHCERARELVSSHFYRSQGVYVIPHGHFAAAYPNQIDRGEARRRLGLGDDHFVYFFFGNVRRYKGLDGLLAAFSALPDPHLRLLLAAKVYNEYGEAFVDRALDHDPRILLRSSRFFANEEFQYLFNAGDVGVFPFTDVLTSGSTITALSFGLPVVVPARGCLPELVTGEAGIVYDPDEADGLREAMGAIRSWDLDVARRAARRLADSLAWDAIARRTVEAYRR